MGLNVIGLMMMVQFVSKKAAEDFQVQGKGNVSFCKWHSESAQKKLKATIVKQVQPNTKGRTKASSTATRRNQRRIMRGGRL